MLTKQQYVSIHYPIAINAVKDSVIFPESLILIALAESAGKASDGKYYPGNSILARAANNHFGIKYTGSGDFFEVATPKDSKKVSKFRKYKTVTDSYNDAVNFLLENDRYQKAGVFDSKDYITQLSKIAAAGYAESPNYLTFLKSLNNDVKMYFQQPGKKSGLFATALILTGFLIIVTNE